MRIFNYNQLKSSLPENSSLIGDTTLINILTASPFEEAEINSITWLSDRNENYLELLNKSKATLIICSNKKEYSGYSNSKSCLLLVDNPKLTFIRLLNILFPKEFNFGIDKTSIIDPQAAIDQNVSIGRFNVIGNVEISTNTVIENHCSINNNTKIGKNVYIKSNSIIGGEGFGYVKDELNNNLRFPHIGGTIISDFVEIGSCVTIDRGTLSNTIIGKHSKIDNLVHIAHNVQIGENCTIIANSIIGGSTVIGDHVWIAPSVTIRDGLNICSNVTIGLGSVVTKDITEAGTYFGIPARLKG